MCASRTRTLQRFALILLTIAAYSACLTAAAGRAQKPYDPERFAHETEIGIESGTSVGNYVVFGYAEGRSVKPIDIEYDRHEWGRFLTARVDYVAEAMPMLLMNEPAKYGLNTLAEGPARQQVYGGGFYPTGARFLWRYNKKFRPYLIGQGGILYFENHVLSPEGAKLNYSGKFGIGAEEALSPKLDLRIGYSDLHVSNGDTAPHNPGIDFMYLYIGVSYRLRNK
jgi:Lipid A 3-O-deacylase (PagL)